MLNYRKPLRRRLSIVIIVSVVMLFVGAISLQAQDAAGGTLRVGMNPTGDVSDPALVFNDPDLALNKAIYDTLVEVSPTDSSIVPNLATEYTISDDGLTYTFTIADGVTFHDGSPLTSADVVYSFNRLKEISSPALALLGKDYTVSAPDASTVVFTIPQKDSVFIYGVASPQAVILKDGTTTPNVLAEGDSPLVNFNGSGPFVLTEYTTGTGGKAVFTRNENYWKEGQPKLAGLEFDYFVDAEAQKNALTTGQVDFIFKLAFDDAGILGQDENLNVIVTPTAQHPVIRLRTDAGHIGEDVRVRQALKYATDRDQINDLMFDGLATVGHNDPIAPFYAQFYNTDFEDTPYDPEMACQLLTEAGKNPLTATLYTTDAFNHSYEDLATILQSMWGETGCINVDIIVVPEQKYNNDFSTPENYFEVDLGITGWGHRATPQILLRLAYVKSGIDTYWNETRYVDDRLEDLVAQANQATDVDQLREIYGQVSEVFKETGPIIIPFFAPLISAANKNVEGLVVDPFPGLIDYRNVTVAG
jgi:peptide/nickel transport system substrate-binding protein